jgi:dedicator of cytokinesis protein 3
VYEQLQQVLPTIECTQLATAMLASLPRDLPPQLAQAKLTAIRHLVTSKLFHDSGRQSNTVFCLDYFFTIRIFIAESRSLLLSATCTHLKPHLAQRNELKLCSDILADITAFLFKQREMQIAAGKVGLINPWPLSLLTISFANFRLKIFYIMTWRLSAFPFWTCCCRRFS